MPVNHYKQGFTTQQQEGIIDSLPVTGKVPEWLSGTLVRNGPGQFEVAHAVYTHWFDGLGMLHRYTFNGGKVSFANRFLKSQAYIKDNADGKLNFRGVCTPPPSTLWEKLWDAIFPNITDNCNIQTIRQADVFVAMTELQASYEFDPYTLDTLVPFKYNDTIDVTMETAHPHFSRSLNSVVNYMIKLDPFSTYDLYQINGHDRKRLAAIPVIEPAYMHSFGITEHYAILTENPMILPSLWGLMEITFGNKPFIFNFDWKPDQPTRFTVVELATGKVVTRVETEGFYCFHHVNAYEKGSEIILDLCAYEDSSIWGALYLDILRSDNFEQKPPYMRRYRIPLQGSKTIAGEQISDVQMELPRINYTDYNAREYRYAYGTGTAPLRPDFVNQIAKIDVTTGEAKTWFVENLYPSEPIFAAHPDGGAEDRGVVLSTVYDAPNDTSFLLVLDGETFEELARAHIGYRIPFGFHGMFYNSVTAPRGVK